MVRVEPYRDQRYSDLKKSCVQRESLFVDHQFPADGSSLYYSKASPANVQWKRPGQLVRNPKLCSGGASSHDLDQGSLGNCWFVAACACLAAEPELVKKTIPDIEYQEWSPENKYSGIFHFRFWRCGDWVDVVVDDRLPTVNGKLLFTRSKTQNEFWAPLLEKAYAKLSGSYEALVGGLSRDGLVDLTGGVGEGIKLKDYHGTNLRQDLFSILCRAKDNRSMMTAHIGGQTEGVTEKGLITGHAYSITAVREIRLGKGLLAMFKRDMLLMVRCRNPWGHGEWNGPWSDNSAEWTNVTDSQKEELGLIYDDNGEFWMTFEDFCEQFTDIEICHIINTSIFSLKKTWKSGETTGYWAKPRRAGGCGNHPSFLNNPQYLFDVTEDKDEILVSVEQEDRRSLKDEGRSNEVIGVTSDVNRVYRMHDKLHTVISGPFKDSRSVFARVTLTMGRYCVIPSTFDPGREAKFSLRVYGNSALDFREVTQDEPPPPGCCGGAYKAATSVSVIKAEGLQRKDSIAGGTDPYCVIKCEGKTAKSHTCENTLKPAWDVRATFYRKKPKENIMVEVWNNNLLLDDFMGMATIDMQGGRPNAGDKMARYPLYGKSNDERHIRRPGYVWVSVKHSYVMCDL